MQIQLVAVRWEGSPEPERFVGAIVDVDAAVVATVVGEDRAIDHIGQRGCDVALVGFAPPAETRVWQLLARIRQVSPHTRLLLLCESCTPKLLLEFVRHGASGYLMLSSEPVVIAKAVRCLHDGQTWFGRTELLMAARSLLPPPGLASSVSIVASTEEALTARERQILRLIGSAMSNKEIARQLGISVATVKTHLHRIYVKLHQSGRYKAFLSDDVGNPIAATGTPARAEDSGGVSP